MHPVVLKDIQIPRHYENMSKLFMVPNFTTAKDIRQTRTKNKMILINFHQYMIEVFKAQNNIPTRNEKGFLRYISVKKHQRV